MDYFKNIGKVLTDDKATALWYALADAKLPLKQANIKGEYGLHALDLVEKAGLANSFYLSGAVYSEATNRAHVILDKLLSAEEELLIPHDTFIERIKRRLRR